jgi:4-hydroxy-2-oxoheptanedioate aldolase
MPPPIDIGDIVNPQRRTCTSPTPRNLMRPNRLRDIWSSGGSAVNGWLAIPNGFSAETMAHQGWDTLTIDLQHGVVDYQAMVSMLQAISTTPTVPVVRVPWLEPGILMKTLHAGAYGVICPMVNTREDAQKLVAYTHYAPRGTRSFGPPVRALLYGGADYPQHANDTIVTFAMIETAQALDKLDDIRSVEGLDAVYIGPSDLSLSLGCKPTIDDVDPKAAQAIEHILERARAHGLVAGIHNATPEAALKRIAKGFQFVTISSDARLIAAGSQQVLSAMRAGQRREAGTGSY